MAKITIVLLCMCMLAACGNGSVEISNVQTRQTTTAVLTLSTTITGSIPSGTTINSYDVTIPLPDGVTVSSTTNPPLTDAAVVTTINSAVGSLVAAVYSAATGTRAALVKIHIASGTGFSAGAFSTVTCAIKAGTDPQASDFTAPTLDDATGFDNVSNSSVLGLEENLSLTSTVDIQ